MKISRLLLSLLLVLGLSFGSTYADKIPESKAIQIAKDFFASSGKIQQQMAVLRTSEDLPILATKGTKGDPKFYVVGNQLNKGFVIVSSDDRFSPILGYSFESSFDQENIPENLQDWFLFLRDQMDWAEKNNVTDNNVAEQWKTGVTAGVPVKYIETASWGQEKPYNNQCPVYSGSTHYYTGCTATAICEVMRYHKYPAKGIGIAPAYKCSSGVSVSARSLSQHTYQWDLMPYTTAEFNTTAKKDAVATLMADVGAALQSNYAAGGTSSRPNQEVLVTKFGYSSATRFDYRDYYTDEAWKALMRKEIDENRPVVYCGYDKTNGGHCFVLDGYDDQDFFHFNWGWDGSDDGYFKLSALDPNAYVFNYSQNALIGFEPQSGTQSDPDQWLNLLAPGITTTTKTFTKNVEFKINKIVFGNCSIKSFSGYFGLLLVDKRDNIVEYLAYSNINDLKPGYYYNFYADVVITSDIKPGYRIRLGYSTDNGNTWTLMWRDDVNPSEIQQEIVVATEDADLLEYRCSAKVSSDSVSVTMPEGSTAALYEGSKEITEGVTKSNTSILIDTDKLKRGTKYKILITRGIESKELYFTLKKREN